MITDTEARKIASEWHGGGGTALYAFSSTGAIDTAREDHDIESEIRECINSASDEQEIEKLRDLLRYTDGQYRSAVPGWSKLT